MRKLKKYWEKGDPFIFLSGAGLIFTLAMVFFMIFVILSKGFGAFWAHDILQIETIDGKTFLGQAWNEKAAVNGENGDNGSSAEIQLKIGNRDIYGLDFKWIEQTEIKSQQMPKNAVLFERWEYGNLYGFIQSLHYNSNIFSGNDGRLMEIINAAHDEAAENRDEIEDAGNRLIELQLPLADIKGEISQLEKTGGDSSKIDELNQDLNNLTQQISAEAASLTEKMSRLKQRNKNIWVTVRIAGSSNIHLPLEDVVRFYQPNAMSAFGKTVLYIKKVWEFISGSPRESNTEGGVFPAIFGTVMMVILMSIFVVPFGVLAAVYLNEYAKQGAATRLIRLSVSNLAGVPSIVYGIFGLGFFIYIVGGSIDQLFFSDKLPTPTLGTGGILWASLTLALLTLPVVVVAAEEGILAVPKANKEAALALGATKWQMIKKIVLPNAMPGILTGIILAVSRGAGEVAPLMITGVVKLAPSLAVDGSFPFFHLERKFMHLGFHIYDVGFQSPNVEAALPMVYTTALLLILIVVSLNLLAIYLRNSLKKKFKTSAF